MLKVFLLLILSLGFNFTTLVHPILAEGDLPEAPETGKPETEAQPGGTRTGNLEDNVCNSASGLNPASLLAQDSQDLTVSEFPSFWFYLPYSQEEVKQIEFILKDPQDQIIYQTSVELTNQPGIREVALPSQPEYSLALDTDYLWELIIACDGHEVTLQGWITRVANTTTSEQQPSYQSYIEQDIFYDAVTQLAQLHQQYPDNREYQTDWADLLSLLGYQDLVTVPILTP
jgi:hypothetical protein